MLRLKQHRFYILFNWFIQYLPLGRIGRIGTMSLEKEGLIPRFEGHQKDCLAEITLATLSLVQNNPKRFSWLMFCFFFGGFATDVPLQDWWSKTLWNFLFILQCLISIHIQKCVNRASFCALSPSNSNAAWRFCCACRCRCRIFDAFQCRWKHQQ